MGGINHQNMGGLLLLYSYWNRGDKLDYQPKSDVVQDERPGLNKSSPPPFGSFYVTLKEGRPCVFYPGCQAKTCKNLEKPSMEHVFSPKPSTFSIHQDSDGPIAFCVKSIPIIWVCPNVWIVNLVKFTSRGVIPYEIGKFQWFSMIHPVLLMLNAARKTPPSFSMGYILVCWLCDMMVGWGHI